MAKVKSKSRSHTKERVGLFVPEHPNALHLAHPSLAEVLAQVALGGVVRQLADEQLEVVVLVTLVL